MASCGSCGPEHGGPICPCATHRTRLATGASNAESVREDTLEWVLEALTQDLNYLGFVHLGCILIVLRQG